MKISLSLCLAAILVTSQGASPDRIRLQAISPELGPMLESFGAETDHPSDYDRVKRGEVTKLSAVAPDITRLESISPDLLESFGADFDQLSESERVKRAGSIFGFIGNKLSSGISSIAHASSGIKSKFTGDDHGPAPEYGPPVESYDHKKFDVWSFKKAILHTLLQAVKAINGGIIAINGQLIKGTGYVVETKGRVLQQKGEKIYEFGKSVAHAALLSPPKTHSHAVPHFRPAHPHHGHSEQLAETYTASHGHDGGYGGHTGYASDEYSVQAAPLAASFTSFGGSAPGSEYGAPHYQVARAVTPAPAQQAKAEATNHYDEKGVKAGLLVLKPIDVSSYSEKRNSYSRSLQTPSTNYQSASKEHASAYQSTKRQAAVPEYESAKRQVPEYESAKRQVAEYESAKRQVPEYESAKRQVPEYRSAKRQESLTEYQSAKRQAPLPEYRSAPRQAPASEYEVAKRQAEYQSAKRQESLSEYRSAKRQAPSASYQSAKQRQAPSSLYLAPSHKYSVFAPPPSMYSQPAASYSALSYRALPPPAAFYRPYSLQQPSYDPSLGYALPSIEYE